MQFNKKSAYGDVWWISALWLMIRLADIRSSCNSIFISGVVAVGLFWLEKLVLLSEMGTDQTSMKP